MCGIVALQGETDPATVHSMLDTIQHRGPDDRAVHDHRAGATLGHTRLSVIDPGGGRQPLTADGTALVCNGMIYNDRLLRARIGPDRFSTETDSESILQGYLAWGTAVVDHIDGMFAFVLVDRDGRCVAARDPLGKKPLFWGRIGTAIVFASEIKALDGLADDIEIFPAGCVWDSRDGMRQYYAVPQPSDGGYGECDALASVRVGLERAIARRLRSDVPLGAFLSGGLDSSVIAAIAQRHLGNLHTYAVGLLGSSDLAAARRVAEHLGTIHHEYVIGPEEITAALPGVIRHLESYDRDLVRSAVPTWFVAREAARHMKVVLTGEGADELFAGYAYHADYTDDEALQEELHRSLTAMHSINLQRVDRMTMGHSLEARVPFLDREMIDLAMSLPAALKQRPEQGCDGEKWILRKACEDLLPPEIVWRGKLQFDEGSGFSEYLADHADRAFEAGEIESVGPDESVEEALYRQLLRDSDIHTDAVMGLTDHWRSGRTIDHAA